MKLQTLIEKGALVQTPPTAREVTWTPTDPDSGQPLEPVTFTVYVRAPPLAGSTEPAPPPPAPVPIASPTAPPSFPTPSSLVKTSTSISPMSRPTCSRTISPMR